MLGFKNNDEKELMWYQQLPSRFKIVINDANSNVTDEVKDILNMAFKETGISYDGNFVDTFLALSKIGVVKSIYFSFGIDSICEKLNSLLYKFNVDIRLSPDELIRNDNVFIKARRERFSGTVTYDLNMINEYIDKYGYEIICFVGTSKGANGGLVANEPRFVTIVPKNILN